MQVDTSVKIDSMVLKNPLLVASGTFGIGMEFQNFFPLEDLGGIILKTVTLNPRQGNPPPRLAETACGLLNSIGLENPGILNFIKDEFPKLNDIGTNIILSIAGEEPDEFLEIVEKIPPKSPISAIEINLSCPNVKKGGIELSRNHDICSLLVKDLKIATKLPIIVKLSALTDNILDFSLRLQDSGADALTLINTIPAMAIDINTRKPKLSTISGGLSGPAIKPIAIKIIYEVSKMIDIPIIGSGGVASSEDAIEFLLAGANCIAVGTFNLVNPKIHLKIMEEIIKYMEKNNLKKIGDFGRSIVLK